MALHFWRWLSHQLKSETTRSIRKYGLVGILVITIGYVIDYKHGIANQQSSAWDTLRTAIKWVEDNPYRTGNMDQIDAIQTLTRDCDHSWRNTFFAPVFRLAYGACEDMKSLTLARMELGGLQAAGADFSHADISCANLTQANLRNTNLQGTTFHGSELAEVDLRGALLTSNPEGSTIDPANDADLSLVNLSGVQIDSTTKVKLAQLKCACSSSSVPNAKAVASSNPLDMLRGLQRCPAQKCGDQAPANWQCSP